MLALGMSDVQVGLVASLSLFMRALTSLVSGSVTDKLGRRRTTVIFDLISWSVPALLWTFAQDMWWVYAAALENGMWQLTENSWTCLMVEDADKRMIVHIYNWLYLSGQLAVFVAPLAGMMVERLTVIPALRVIYAFTFVSMSAKFIILYKYSAETENGVKRLRETRGQSLFSVLSEYKELIPRFFRSGEMRLATVISVLMIVVSTIIDNFFGIYTTQRLGAPDHYLAYFPIIRSAVLFAFLLFIQPRLFRFGYKGPMLAGVALYVVSHMILIMPNALGIAFGGPALAPALYTFALAFAHGLVMPRKDSLVALCIDPQERARMTSILTITMLSVTIPFGYIAGALSELNRSLPFALNILLFIVTFFIILLSKKLGKNGEFIARADEGA
jgi:MFS family permease